MSESRLHVPTVTIQDLAVLVQGGEVEVVDVRTLEFFIARIPGSWHAPFPDFEKQIERLESNLASRRTVLAFVCSCGTRKAELCAQAFLAHLDEHRPAHSCDVRVLDGGFSMWERTFATHVNASLYISRGFVFNPNVRFGAPSPSKLAAGGNQALLQRKQGLPHRRASSADSPKSRDGREEEPAEERRDCGLRAASLDPPLWRRPSGGGDALLPPSDPEGECVNRQGHSVTFADDLLSQASSQGAPTPKASPRAAPSPRGDDSGSEEEGLLVARVLSGRSYVQTTDSLPDLVPVPLPQDDDPEESDEDSRSSAASDRSAPDDAADGDASEARPGGLGADAAGAAGPQSAGGGPGSSRPSKEARPKWYDSLAIGDAIQVRSGGPQDWWDATIIALSNGRAKVQYTMRGRFFMKVVGVGASDMRQVPSSTPLAGDASSAGLAVDLPAGAAVGAAAARAVVPKASSAEELALAAAGASGRHEVAG